MIQLHRAHARSPQGGRSVARVNGRTVNVGLLKELGALLIDIHGQAEHLSLLDPRAHLACSTASPKWRGL